MHREITGAVFFFFFFSSLTEIMLNPLFYFWKENYGLKHFWKFICLKEGHAEVSFVFL